MITFICILFSSKNNLSNMQIIIFPLTDLSWTHGWHGLPCGFCASIVIICNHTFHAEWTLFMASDWIFCCYTGSANWW
jgi:hypothetical protein